MAVAVKLLAVLILLGLPLLAFRQFARRWALGADAPIRWQGLATIPKRYFVDLHHVVARDAAAARFHMYLAGGLIGAAVLFIAAMAFSPVLPWLNWLTLGLLTPGWAGLALLCRRRFGADRSPNRSAGSWDRFPLALGALLLALTLLSIGGLMAGGVLNIAGLVLLALSLWLLLFSGASQTRPMKHAFAGLMNLAFHPRPGRFRDNGLTDSALKPLVLDRQEFGADTPVDFAWNRLLNFDACVQCGRCEAACPAHAAGQPLNPKKLVQDLVTGFSGPADDGDYAGTLHSDAHRRAGESRGGPTAPIVPDLLAAETLWSCTTCRACVAECPMFVEHVDAVVDLRRHLTLGTGDLPAAANQVIENLRYTDNPAGVANDRRFAWAADLDLIVLEPGMKTDVLFWVGDAAFDLKNQKTLRQMVQIMRRAGIDFAVLGADELDSGDVARRLGHEAVWQDLARRNIATLNTRNFRRIVTADPHAFHNLAQEYPALGGRWTVLHHTAFLAALVADGSLPVRSVKDADAFTFHDPCYLGRYNNGFQPPRDLLAALGIEMREMDRSRRTSRCCGWGGGAAFTDIPGDQRIPDMRMDDVRDSGATTVITACPNCATMFDGVVEPRPAARDITDLVWEACQ